MEDFASHLKIEFVGQRERLLFHNNTSISTGNVGHIEGGSLQDILGLVDVIKVLLVEFLLIDRLDTDDASNLAIDGVFTYNASKTLFATYRHIGVAIGKFHIQNCARNGFHEGIVLTVPKGLVTHMDVARHNRLGAFENARINGGCTKLLVDEWPHTRWFPILVVLGKGGQYRPESQYCHDPSIFLHVLMHG